MRRIITHFILCAVNAHMAHSCLDWVKSEVVISKTTSSDERNQREIMYLSGSKWNMRKKRKPLRPWRILLLLVLIAGVVATFLALFEDADVFNLSDGEQIDTWIRAKLDR